MRLNEYPKTIKELGARSNFKRACKNFSIENGQFLYKEQRAIVMAKQQLIKEIIKEFHKGVSQSSHFKVMAENQLIQNFPSASFGIQFVKMLNLRSCENWQKQGDLKLKTNSIQHSISIPSNIQTL